MPEIPSTVEKSSGLWKAVAPGDRRNARTKAYMPSPPDGVKELNSLSFMQLLELSDIARLIFNRGGAGQRSRFLRAAAHALLRRRGRLAPARNRKSTG